MRRHAICFRKPLPSLLSFCVHFAEHVRVHDVDVEHCAHEMYEPHATLNILSTTRMSEGGSDHRAANAMYHAAALGLCLHTCLQTRPSQRSQCVLLFADTSVRHVIRNVPVSSTLAPCVFLACLGERRANRGRRPDAHHRPRHGRLPQRQPLLLWWRVWRIRDVQSVYAYRFLKATCIMRAMPVSLVAPSWRAR